MDALMGFVGVIVGFLWEWPLIISTATAAVLCTS